MAESHLAVSPVNPQDGAILTFAFPMLLFIVVTLVLWGLFARFRPAWVDHFQTAIDRGPGTLTAAPGRAGGATLTAPGMPAGDAGQAPPDDTGSTDAASTDVASTGTGSTGTGPAAGASAQRHGIRRDRHQHGSNRRQARAGTASDGTQ